MHREHRGGLVAAVLSAAVLVAGCGGEQGEPEATAAGSSDTAAPAPEVRQLYAPDGARPVGPDAPGDMQQYADCYDWNAGSRDEKVATVVALREQLTPQGSADPVSPLDDVLAFRRLEQTCTSGYTKSLRLYKLYVRMQAYGTLADTDLG
ncbi:hypothetical protein HJD18_02860 [Thermoleophilia bacterium SCSIO 60948]|nr:hypothetical protein HJD18_02860 [Thermoleophilia bacterium SCSIO 60948]